MTEPRNIWAVGRNYGEHAKELGNAVPVAADEPMIFLKAGSTIVASGSAFSFPTFTDDIHHECEIAFRFDDRLRFSQMTIALDLTARDVQAKLKASGHPWTLAKSFRDSCPLGRLVAIPEGTDLQTLKFFLDVNGKRRQTGLTSDMIHSVEKLRVYLIERFPVCAGDLLLSGTPKGVAQLKKGDHLSAEIEGFVQAQWRID